MKAFICITSLLACAMALPQFLGGHALLGHGVAPLVARPLIAHAPLIARPVIAHAAGYAAPDLAEPSPYSYTYAVADDYSKAAFSQSESNDGTGAVSGSYSVNLPDGRIQHVTYNANDLTGNIAQVTYEGTAAYPPAAAIAHPIGGRPLALAHPLLARPVAIAHPALAVAHPALIG